MTLSLHVRQNGSEINLPVSSAQRTFCRALSTELIVVLGADAISYSTVTKSLRQRRFTSILVDSSPPEEPATILIDQAILDAFEHYPFSSVRELARLTCIPTATVHRHLTQSLGFVLQHIAGFPRPSRLLTKGSVSLSQLSSCASSGPSRTTAGSSLSPLTSHGSIFL
jgi:hypothetical protein